MYISIVLYNVYKRTATIKFNAIDANGDGVITRAEFNAAMGGQQVVGQEESTQT